MAGPINLKLLTDFFNKIGQQRTNCQIYFPANPTCTKPKSQDFRALPYSTARRR